MPCSAGIEVRHMWGMTEISPLGSLGLPTGSEHRAGLSQREAVVRKVCDDNEVDKQGARGCEEKRRGMP